MNFVKLLIPIFTIVFGVSVFLGYTYYKESSKLKNKTVENGSEITLKGVVKKGSDIDPQSSYCPDQFYIKSGEKTYQLRSPDRAGEAATTLYSKFRDSQVKINTTYRDIIPDCSGIIKDCSCDSFVLVNDIEKLSSAPSDFPVFSGTISCLPGQEECTLAFLDNSGKYFILKNIADGLIVKGTTLSFTGELTPVPNTGDGVEGVIDVVEVK